MSMIPYDKKMKLLKEEEERLENLVILEKGFQVADVFINNRFLDNFSSATILEKNRYNNI